MSKNRVWNGVANVAGKKRKIKIVERKTYDKTVYSVHVQVNFIWHKIEDNLSAEIVKEKYNLDVLASKSGVIKND